MSIRRVRTVRLINGKVDSRPTSTRVFPITLFFVLLPVVPTVAAAQSPDASVVGRSPDVSVLGQSPDVSVLGQSPDDSVVGRSPDRPTPNTIVRLTPETASLFIHEPFTLRLEVASQASPEPPEFPAVRGLAVTKVGSLPFDAARGTHVFQIELIAQRSGILNVPPFTVLAGDERLRTPALRLRIDEPRPAAEMTLEITVEPTELRVGQPATVTMNWTSAASFSRCKQLLFAVPLLADSRCQLFALDPRVPDADQIGLPVNNTRVFARTTVLPDNRHRLSFRYTLIPHEPCVLRADPARIACALLKEEPSSGQPPSYFYNQFFTAPEETEVYERLYLTAPVPELTVRALPEAVRNARFAQIVGPCDLHASVAPADLVIGQPALFTVHLDNLSFARHITGLPSAAFDGLRPEFQVSAEPIRETATDHDRSFTHILRPLRPGITRIAAIVIQTFDPDTGEYQTLRSEPIPIAVAPDPEDVSRTVVPRVHSQPPIQLNGIRHNRADEKRMAFVQNLLEFLGRYWWVFLPLAPLVWLALLPPARRWERCRRDPAYARAVGAWWRFCRLARRDEELAWRNYLADRLGLCAEALTAITVTEALRARQVDDELIAETCRRFEEKDAADYGRRAILPSTSTEQCSETNARSAPPSFRKNPPSSAFEPCKHDSRPLSCLVKRLQKATAGLLLACGLLVPVHVAAADDPDALFERAMQMREERPDEAQPLFVEAALGYESEERYLNAGNGWVFAGENGRALANYRAAAARSPFDSQVRESIEFLRANRTDAFPSPATPTGKLATFWKRLCAWATVLRVGLLVLIYLVAWLVFATAQLMGWRARSAVWVVFAAAALVPLVSVVQTSLQPAEGVVIEDTVARLGPGYAYDPAFEHSLHEAAEFSWLETRRGWVRARLPDASEGWLRESDCMQLK